MLATRQQRSNRKKWLILIALAIVLHLVVLLTLRQSFFDIFRKSVNAPSDATRAGGGFPDAIIAIPVVIDGDEPSPNPPTDSPSVQPGDKPALSPGDPGEVVDLRDIVGETLAPLPSEGSGRTTAVPPRPLEITWPETRNLRHCLDSHVDIRIHVGEDGEILAVEPAASTDPADCVAAAVEAARRIQFAPGRIKGKPAAMWTQIRIDFRDR